MAALPEWPKDDDFPDRATAEAYANANPKLHLSVDGQRIHLSKQWLFPHACPNCLVAMAVVDAIHEKGDNFKCSACGVRLLFTVPLVQVGPVYWEWRLAPGQIASQPEKGNPS
jgi:predicted RNA-binding Zn-ribbon protein involved in translation (DUF1610 family)